MVNESSETSFLLKHSFIYGIGTISSQMIGFIMLPIYTRHLTPKDYGVLQLIEISTFQLGMVITTGISQTLSRFYYDYDKKEHRNNLVKIFEKDENGDFGSGHKLADKLLWGSDVPMVISGKSFREGQRNKGESKYKHYFNGFLTAIHSSNKLSAQQQAQLITNMTEINPKKFLRLP